MFCANEISILAFESNQFTCQRNTHEMWCTTLLNATGHMSKYVLRAKPGTDENLSNVDALRSPVAIVRVSRHLLTSILWVHRIRAHFQLRVRNRIVHTLVLIDTQTDWQTDRHCSRRGRFVRLQLAADNVGNMFVNKLWFRKQHQFNNRHFVSSHRQHYGFIYTFQRVVLRYNDVAMMMLLTLSIRNKRWQTRFSRIN